MKNHTLIFTLLLLLLGACSSPSNKAVVEAENKEIQEDPRLKLPLEEQLRLKIVDELVKGERIDDIILDHQFGMTRKAVIRHKEKLVNEKRIYPVFKTKNTRAFVYDLHLPESGATRTYFDTYYVDGRLYKMECKPIIPKGKATNEISAEAVQLFSKKYGPPHYVIPHTDSTHCATSYWIDRNLQIDIQCDKKEALITYTDLEGMKEKLEDI